MKDMAIINNLIYTVFLSILSSAPYNITGNEDCIFYNNLSECSFGFSRYFSESKTVLFFLRNDVSKTVNKVTINIYEGKNNFYTN